MYTQCISNFTEQWIDYLIFAYLFAALWFIIRVQALQGNDVFKHLKIILSNKAQTVKAY